jgi:BirA family biotin operon repressor/biotin-[acetyl-CoA-carboxylase] ligase
MSIAWPMVRPAGFYDPAPLVAALAVEQAIRHIAEDLSCGELASRLRVKWPNDLLLDGRKVAGVLCERTLSARMSAESGRQRAAPPDLLIVGVGINVDFDVALLPAETLRFPATTLREALGVPVSVEDVIAAFSRHMLRLMHEFDRDGLTSEMLGQLRSLLAFEGCMIQMMHEGGGAIRGRQAGLDHDGRLLLETDEGIVACAAGEISRVRLAEDADADAR